jgi:hypothetical membrane protein
MNTRQQHIFTTTALYMGVAVPILYFGIQLLATPFFPNYNFVDHVASLLGSDLSTFPAIFNIGAIVTGILACIASFGFLRALQKLGVHWLLAWLICAVLLSAALGNLWAGIFPMPDPRHSANPFAIGLFATPFLLPLVLWKLRNSKFIEIYFLVNILLFIVLVLSKSGVMPLELFNHEGIFQRTFAFVAFAPIGVSAYMLAQQLKNINK